MRLRLLHPLAVAPLSLCSSLHHQNPLFLICCWLPARSSPGMLACASQESVHTSAPPSASSSVHPTEALPALIMSSFQVLQMRSFMDLDAFLSLATMPNLKHMVVDLVTAADCASLHLTPAAARKQHRLCLERLEITGASGFVDSEFVHEGQRIDPRVAARLPLDRIHQVRWRPFRVLGKVCGCWDTDAYDCALLRPAVAYYDACSNLLRFIMLAARLRLVVPVPVLLQVQLAEGLHLVIPKDLPTSTAVNELAAAADNLVNRCPGLKTDSSMSLKVLNVRAARTKLSALMEALAPLGPLCRNFRLSGPFIHKDDFDADALPPVADRDSESDSDNDSECDTDSDSDGGYGFECPDTLALPMVFCHAHLQALARALPGLLILTLTQCRVTYGVLPAVCSALPELVRLVLAVPICGAVGASDLVMCCATAPRQMTLCVDGQMLMLHDQYGQYDAKRVLIAEVRRAQRTLLRYPGTKGHLKLDCRWFI